MEKTRRFNSATAKGFHIEEQRQAADRPSVTLNDAPHRAMG
jgi:hypothetical protein